MTFCPKCNGLLNSNNKGARCFCSDRPPSKAAPAQSSPTEQPTDLFPESWLALHAKDLGPSCIVTVRSILNQLPPHFIQQGKAVLTEMPEPLFLDSEERVEVTRKIFRAKSHAVKELIAELPNRHRQAAANLAWLLDEHMGEKVNLEDCRIQWFNKKIEWEQAWLDALLALDRLRRDDFHPSDFAYAADFGFAPDDLMFYTCADHQSIRRHQDQLNRARSIVGEATAALAFAKAFYLNPHFSRPAKQALAEACFHVGSRT
jgi:hypothetical protein